MAFRYINRAQYILPLQFFNFCKGLIGNARTFLRIEKMEKTRMGFNVYYLFITHNSLFIVFTGFKK
jgi:hypothetical protein